MHAHNNELPKGKIQKKGKKNICGKKPLKKKLSKKALEV
jgi:hypothetical protein